MMNIGLVSQALPYLPSRGGFRLYGGNLIRHLSRRHQIHLVSMLIDDGVVKQVNVEEPGKFLVSNVETMLAQLG